VRFARDEILKQINSYEALPIFLRFYRATITQLVNFSSVKRIDTSNFSPEFPERFTPLLCHTSLSPSELTEAFDSYSQHSFDSQLKFPPVLTLSLSGGVDSMVSLYLAKCIFKRDVIAVHINYGNRETANDEEEMIAWYCEKLQIPFYVRRITEITRTRDYNREFYEEITRKIRFSAYRELGRPVVLGHNQTDCEENIIHNLKKRQNFSNLIGMREDCVIDGVQIIRPMLSVSKEEMYRIANHFGIPYFANSTPAWSERGIAREKILPQIPDNVRSGLLALSAYIFNIDEVFNEMVNSIEIREVRDTLVFETSLINEAVYGRIFSKRNIRISHKALEYTVSRFRNGKANERVRLNRECFITRVGNLHTIHFSQQ
jgi:tRNA(Ile)-lysidine synthetase-like protein